MSKYERPYYFPFYPEDWLADSNVRLMSASAKGIYITLLCVAWTETPGGTLPYSDVRLRGGDAIALKSACNRDEIAMKSACNRHRIRMKSACNRDEIIAKMADVSLAVWLRNRDAVLARFTLGDDGRLHHERMEADYQTAFTKARAKAEAGRAGGSKRWGTGGGGKNLAMASAIPKDSVLLSQLELELELERTPPLTPPHPQTPEIGPAPVPAVAPADAPATPGIPPTLDFGPDRPAPDAPQRPRPARGRPNGIEMARMSGPPGFDAWWAAYPRNRKSAKTKCAKAWRALGLESRAADILAVLRSHVASPEWAKDGGQYIPLTSTWLNQERWLQNLTPPERFASDAQIEQIFSLDADRDLE